MQTAMTAPFSNVRITLAHKESLRAMVSVKIADLFFLTGLRIIDGKRGLFVSMPSKKEAGGDYKDICFPASREIREQLNESVLAAYREALEKTSVGEPAALAA